MSMEEAWTNVCNKAKETHARCFTDPLDSLQLSWFANFSLNMKRAMGAVPGVFSCVVQALVPGLCRDASNFVYSYTGKEE